MNKKFFFSGLVVLIIVIGTIIFTDGKEIDNNPPDGPSTTLGMPVPAPGTENVDEMTVSETIAIDSGAFFFSVKEIQTAVGETVKLDISSQGVHTFTIDELDVDVRTPHGETTRVEFVATKKGTFQYYCAIPGHREAGQVGILVVN
jgi:plastocyanin